MLCDVTKDQIKEDGWARHVACVREKTSANTVFTEKPERGGQC
jgi:hypothetical protein